VPDYGRPLEFGISLVPEAAAYPDIVELTREADRLGLDLLGVQDHPYQRRFLDTMSLLPALAAYTERLRVFPDVANLPLRHPAMLAKAAASVDVMSGGRFELGLGAGAFWEAIAAMGGPTRTPGEALGALAEAVEILRLMWTAEGGVRYEGEYYAVRGAKPGPAPAHDIGIWLGVYGPRALALLGRVGDGWVPSLGRVTLAELASRHEVIDAAALEAGRDPAAIRRLVNFGGALGMGEAEAAPDSTQAWVDRLTPMALHHGFDSFIFWPDGDRVAQVRGFAAAAPAVRAAVSAARAGTA